ncbi:MAG TPA: hypothetical protein PK854_06310 [Oscillospiraceae bacterium]|nr:hypothetical protein [Oscillospiraceae bacterium]HPS34859.1 hypothetical protein [Oscillospiraceae bacterium]
MVFAAAIFSAIQAIIGLVNISWLLTLLFMLFSLSIFLTWKDCRKTHLPVLGLKLLSFSNFIFIFAIIFSLTELAPVLSSLTQRNSNIHTDILTLGLAIGMLIIMGAAVITGRLLFWLFYRSLYFVTIRKTEKIRFAGFVSVINLILPWVMGLSILMLISANLSSFINGGWTDLYVSNTFHLIPWLYLNIPMTKGVYFIIETIYLFSSGVSGLLIGLSIKNIKNVWRY